MCGIGGIRRYGEEPINKDHLDQLLLGIQNRGIDATGVALVNPTGSNKGVHVYKQDDPAWDVISDKDYIAYLNEYLGSETTIAILHTRAATKGSPRESKNNHPMFNGKVAVVHNGMINNDDWLFTDLKLKRKAETDSDILRAILDEEGLSKAGIRKLAKISGSVACAAVSEEQLDTLLLIRSGNPLVAAEIRDFFVFASEKSAIHSAMRPWSKKWGLDFHKSKADIGWHTIRDHSAWLMGAKGLEWHDECKISYNYTEPRRQVYAQYQERQQRWNTGTTRRVILTPDGNRGGAPLRYKCGSCKALNKLEKIHYTVDAALLDCGVCQKPLVQAVS